MQPHSVDHGKGVQMSFVTTPGGNNSTKNVKMHCTRGSTTEIDLEATAECNILFAESILFREKVNERVRAILNRSPGNELVDKHSLTCGLFMTSSMHAAIFLGKDYTENLHSVRSTDQKPTVQKLFDVTQKLIREQKLEISGVSESCWGNSTLEKLALADDEEVIQVMKAKVYVFSGSVLCVGKMRDFAESYKEWESRLQLLQSTGQYRELDGSDGEPMDFEWMIFPGHTSLQILHENQRFMDTLECILEDF